MANECLPPHSTKGIETRQTKYNAIKFANFSSQVEQIPYGIPYPRIVSIPKNQHRTYRLVALKTSHSPDSNFLETDATVSATEA